MKIQDKIEKYLIEGTWSYPGTVKKAKELEKIFQKKIPLNKATDILYNYLGDDHFFDNLDDMATDMDATDDIRNAAANFLSFWIGDLDKKTLQGKKIKWKRAWQPEAIEILVKIVNKYGTRNIKI